MYNEYDGDDFYFDDSKVEEEMTRGDIMHDEMMIQKAIEEYEKEEINNETEESGEDA